jgi:hypothetical protein
LSHLTKDSVLSTEIDFPLKPRDYASLAVEKINEIPHRVVKPKILDFPEELSPSPTRLSIMKVGSKELLSPQPHESRNPT